VPHLTLGLSQSGPVLEIVVGASQARADALRQAGQGIPSSVTLWELIDTGGSSSVIDQNILDQLVLQPTGVAPIHTPSTDGVAHNCPQYDVSIRLQHPMLQLQLDPRPVIATNLSVQGIQALIGRDILQNCLLIYDGYEQQFTLAF